MFHVELRQFPHVARTFNLSEAELTAKILVPWSEGQLVPLGERKWQPATAKLTIVEGRELRIDEISMGRGWPNALKHGQEVTERMVAGAGPPATAAAAGEPSDSLATFKDVVHAQCSSAPLAVHQALWLANSRHPGWRVSERLALAERAVWELLHEGRVRMVRRVTGDDGPSDVAAGQDEWGPALLTWASWSDAGTACWYLVAAG